MPAKSIAQRQLMAIAEHHPEEVSAKNRGVLKMSHKQLHEFADTKGLKKKHVDAVNHLSDKIMAARRKAKRQDRGN